MNRRLVPMPERRRSDRRQIEYEEPMYIEHERIKDSRSEHIEGGEAQAAVVTKKVPRFGIDMVLLTITAVAIHFLWPYRTLILGVGVVVLAWRFFNWACNKSPAFGWFAVGFIRGLMGWRGRRW